MNGTAHWLNFLKLRVSYGKVGNDGVIKVPRFLFLQTMGTLTNVLNPEPGGRPTIYRICESEFEVGSGGAGEFRFGDQVVQRGC